MFEAVVSALADKKAFKNSSTNFNSVTLSMFSFDKTPLLPK